MCRHSACCSIYPADWCLCLDKYRYANNTFFFFDIKENTNTSTFSGNENLIGGGQAPFTGSFLNHDIIFVYNAGSAKKGTYKGTVNNASTIIILTSSDNLPALALKK